jgi:ComF family protein
VALGKGVGIEIKNSLNNEIIRGHYLVVHSGSVTIEVVCESHDHQRNYVIFGNTVTGKYIPKSMNSTAQEILLDFVSLFFPSHCPACGDALVKGEEFVCTGCMLELPQTDHHLEPENDLFRRLSFRIPVRYAMALFRFSKSGRVQQLLHALKYRNHPEIGNALGRFYGLKILETGFFSDEDEIIPVPLHLARLRRRGYNQSARFASGLSDALGIPCADGVLLRKKVTESQTAKTKLSRWENMRGVFSLAEDSDAAHSVVGKRVILVDDVITTGATLEACAEVLVSGGCQELSIVCIAAV